MEKMRVLDTDDAVSGVMALREILSAELDRVERLIARRRQSSHVDADDMEQIQDYERLRTSLHSGIASANEVLGWVRVLAPKDPDGNELDCVRSLPYVTALPLV